MAVSKHKSSKLDPFKSYLDSWWNEGYQDAVRLTEEICERGYRGASRTVRRYLEPPAGRRNPGRLDPTATQATPGHWLGDSPSRRGQ